MTDTCLCQLICTHRSAIHAAEAMGLHSQQLADARALVERVHEEKQVRDEMNEGCLRFAMHVHPTTWSPMKYHERHVTTALQSRCGVRLILKAASDAVYVSASMAHVVCSGACWSQG